MRLTLEGVDQLAAGPRLAHAAAAAQLEAVEVEGETAYVLGADVEDLMAAQPSNTVRLLPGHDQWVIGPGTKDEHVVPPAQRAPITHKANLVVAGGVVGGTWSITGSEVKVSWFTGQGKPPRKALEAEAARGRDHPWPAAPGGRHRLVTAASQNGAPGCLGDRD